MGFFADPVQPATVGSQIVYLLCTFFIIAIFVRALLSWFNMDPYNPLIQTLNSVTEPVLDPFRRIIPRISGIDFSPLAAMIVLGVVSNVLQQFLIDSGI